MSLGCSGFDAATRSVPISQSLVWVSGMQEVFTSCTLSLPSHCSCLERKPQQSGGRSAPAALDGNSGEVSCPVISSTIFKFLGHVCKLWQLSWDLPHLLLHSWPGKWLTFCPNSSAIRHAAIALSYQRCGCSGKRVPMFSSALLNPFVPLLSCSCPECFQLAPCEGISNHSPLIQAPPKHFFWRPQEVTNHYPPHSISAWNYTASCLYSFVLHKMKQKNKSRNN